MTPRSLKSPFAAFTSHKVSEQVTCRPVVRRVKRLNPKASPGQGELFDTYRYHPSLTNSTLAMLEADERHRAMPSSNKSWPN